MRDRHERERVIARHPLYGGGTCVCPKISEREKRRKKERKRERRVKKWKKNLKRGCAERRRRRRCMYVARVRTESRIDRPEVRSAAAPEACAGGALVICVLFAACGFSPRRSSASNERDVIDHLPRLSILFSFFFARVVAQIVSPQRRRDARLRRFSRTGFFFCFFFSSH